MKQLKAVVSNSKLNFFSVALPYNQDAILFFKTLQRKKYNMEELSWCFHNNDFEKVMKKFEELQIATNDIRINKDLRAQAIIKTESQYSINIVIEYDPNTVNFFRSCKTKKYHADNKSWSFLMEDAKIIVNKLIEMDYNIIYENCSAEDLSRTHETKYGEIFDTKHIAMQESKLNKSEKRKPDTELWRDLKTSKNKGHGYSHIL